MGINERNQEVFLFNEMKKGKEYAFDFFFNYYYPGLCIYAQNVISIQEEESKNLVQDVFLKFWKDRKKITINSSVRSYLFRSVKNICLDHIRKAKTNIELNEDIASVDVADTAMETFILVELETLFLKSLDKLPDRCREVFELSRFEGLKNREIAVLMDISEKTVENQMSKALRILKTELKDYLPVIALFESLHFFN